MLKKIPLLLPIFLILFVVSSQLFGIIPVTYAEPPPDQWDYRDASWTTIEKPGFPEYIPTDYIDVGRRRTYVAYLHNDTQYHVYFYGGWIGSSTDYDVFVYDPDGYLETYHTEAAGLMEHLGTTVDTPLFTPKKEGLYSFLVINDDRESQNALNGTFMIIENLDINKQYRDKLFMEGKDPVTDQPRFFTIWVYEFNTSSPHIEIPIEVPETLDMYEARLYLMANPALELGQEFVGMPIAWEPGLYGDLDSGVGGFDVDNRVYRGNAFDSCEYPGQDMLINYTSQYSGNLLYHLVFIAELGDGYLEFVIKTDFDDPYLEVIQPSVVPADEETIITAIAYDTDSGLESVSLTYSINNGSSWSTLLMNQTQPQVYTAEIPSQPKGTTVLYKIEASDNAGNKAIEEGSFECRATSTLSLNLSEDQITAGESIIISGSLTPIKNDTSITIQCFSPLGTVKSKTVMTDSLGQYSTLFEPDTSGAWIIVASWSGDLEYMASTNTTYLTVEKIVSQLDLSLNKKSLNLGERVEITGGLTPILADATIKLIIVGPQGNATTIEVYTSSQGTYSYIYKPQSLGSWSITALYAGDNLHKSASSSALPFKVHEFLWGLLSWPKVLIIPIIIGIVVVVVLFFFRRKPSLRKEVVRRETTYRPNY